jgi:gliding motility-associated-like protein
MTVSNDTTICPGDSVLISGYLMVKYEWMNYDNAKIQKDASKLKVSPSQKTVYELIGYDTLNCKTTEKITINVYPKHRVDYVISQDADWENPAIIHVANHYYKSLTWTPKTGLNCDSCNTVYASITENTNYKVIAIDKNNCIDSAIIYLDFVDVLYVPNSFYPDSKNGNAIFKAVGVNIREFQMEIYDRWGERIAVINNIEEGWDGTYKGIKCSNDVYVWKIKYTSMREKYYELNGHVSIVR